MFLVLDYRKISVYRICEAASRLITFNCNFNPFFNFKSFLFSEEENYQWVVLLIKAQLSDQQHMGLVTWRISVIIKSGGNSRTTHIITIIAFHIQAELQLKEESKARIQAQVQWNFWVIKVKASQGRSSSLKKAPLKGW